MHSIRVKKIPLYIASTMLLVVCCSLAFLFPSPTILAEKRSPTPKAVLIPTEKFLFNSFVDCNMAEAWVGDTFRIFPGKYGEDPLWRNARDLKYADGANAEEAFSRAADEFTEPSMPNNVLPGTEGLHGAVWFETIYQD